MNLASIFFPFKFFWQISFHNLMLSKLTGIWHCDTLLYVGHEFDIVIQFFGSTFDRKIRGFPNSSTFTLAIHFHVLITFFLANLVTECNVVKGWATHIDFRKQCVIMTQTRWTQPSCHMHHSQNFDKTDSFLKSVLNISILSNLIVGRGERVIKEGVGILHQIYRFSGGVNIWQSRIHQSKSWYYLVPSQTSKLEIFTEIVFG